MVRDGCCTLAPAPSQRGACEPHCPHQLLQSLACWASEVSPVAESSLSATMSASSTKTRFETDQIQAQLHPRSSSRPSASYGPLLGHQLGDISACRRRFSLPDNAPGQRPSIEELASHLKHHTVCDKAPKNGAERTIAAGELAFIAAGINISHTDPDDSEIHDQTTRQSAIKVDGSNCGERGTCAFLGCRTHRPEDSSHRVPVPSSLSSVIAVVLLFCFSELADTILITPVSCKQL